MRVSRIETGRTFKQSRVFKHARRAAAAGVLAGAAMVSGPAASLPAAHAAEQIKVFMGQARILKLDRAVDKVIVGSSAIADVTVADPRTVVLTGKAFGTTNLVILSKEGEALVDRSVLVSIDEANTVRVFRQSDRSVLSCSPNCQAQADIAGQ